MKIALVLLYLGFISVDARPHAGFKPNPNLPRHKFKIPTTPKPVLPEDRRKLPFFPKSSKKFTISLDVKDKILPEDPIVSATKKPLMKKLAIHEKHAGIEKPHMHFRPRLPIMARTANNIFDKDPKSIEKENHIDSEEISIEILQENFKEDSEDNDSQDDDKELERKTDNKIQPVDPVATKIIKSLELETKTESKPLDSVTTESSKKSNEISIAELLLDKSDNSKASEEKKEANESADEKEYIFLTPEKETAVKEESVEFVTTEEPPKTGRIKRSDNVIEEENLGTTLAGYKYTWRDTKLTNDLVFKNIHS